MSTPATTTQQSSAAGTPTSVGGNSGSLNNSGGNSGGGGGGSGGGVGTNTIGGSGGSGGVTGPPPIPPAKPILSSPGAYKTNFINSTNINLSSVGGTGGTITAGIHSVNKSHTSSSEKPAIAARPIPPPTLPKYSSSFGKIDRDRNEFGKIDRAEREKVCKNKIVILLFFLIFLLVLFFFFVVVHILYRLEYRYFIRNFNLCDEIFIFFIFIFVFYSDFFFLLKL